MVTPGRVRGQDKKFVHGQTDPMEE
jgi:hypothetical protein